MNWLAVRDILVEFAQDRLLVSELPSVVLDSLHGTMWGMNIRYTPLSEALHNHKQEMTHHTLKRIRQLFRTQPDLPHKDRTELMPKCGVGFGTYGWKYDHTLIEKAIKLGAVVIDTAEGYGFGKVETELGKCDLRGVRVATKVSHSHMSPTAIVSAAMRSYKKLGVLPHYQLHFPSVKYDMFLTMDRLVRLRAEGVIQSFGLGNCSMDMVELCERYLCDHSGDMIDSVQVRYNIADRRIEKCLLPYCQKHGIVVYAYSPLGQKFQTIDKPILSRIGKKYGASPQQLAIAWLLSRKGVVPIPRTNNPRHLEANMDAGKLELSPEDVEELDAAYPVKEYL